MLRRPIESATQNWSAFLDVIRTLLQAGPSGGPCCARRLWNHPDHSSSGSPFESIAVGPDAGDGSEAEPHQDHAGENAEEADQLDQDLRHPAPHGSGVAGRHRTSQTVG